MEELGRPFTLRYKTMESVIVTFLGNQKNFIQAIRIKIGADDGYRLVLEG